MILFFGCTCRVHIVELISCSCTFLFFFFASYDVVADVGVSVPPYSDKPERCQDLVNVIF